MTRHHRWPKKAGRCLNMCGMTKAVAKRLGGPCRIPRKCADRDDWNGETGHCWHGLSCCQCGAISRHKAQRNAYGICVHCGGKIHPDPPEEEQKRLIAEHRASFNKANGGDQ